MNGWKPAAAPFGPAGSPIASPARSPASLGRAADLGWTDWLLLFGGGVVAGAGVNVAVGGIKSGNAVGILIGGTLATVGGIIFVREFGKLVA